MADFKQFFILFISCMITTCIECRPKWTKQKQIATKTALRTNTMGKVCQRFPDRKVCSQNHDTCKEDSDCGDGKLCCFDGCVYTCSEPVAKKMKGNRLIIEDGELVKSKNMVCSTSNFTDHGPVLCPQGYICDIQRKGDKEKQIPNSGICKIGPYKDVDPFEPQEWNYDENFKGCYYRSKTLADGQYFFNDCNFCFCSSGIINCQLIKLCWENKQQLRKPPNSNVFIPDLRNHVHDSRN